MAWRGSGVRIPSAPPRNYQVKSSLTALILRGGWELQPYWEEFGRSCPPGLGRDSPAGPVRLALSAHRWSTGEMPTGVPAWFGSEWRQQGVEQRDRGVRVDGGALPQGFLPPGLKVCGQLVTHPRRGVGVQAAHPGHLVPEPLLGQDLGNAVLSHPCLVAVPKAVRRQPVLDRQPAGQRRVAGGLLAAAGAVAGLVLVRDGPPVEAQPDRVPAGLAARRVL